MSVAGNSVNCATMDGCSSRSPVIDPEVEAIELPGNKEQKPPRICKARFQRIVSGNKEGNGNPEMDLAPKSAAILANDSSTPRPYNAKWRRVEWYTKFKESQAKRMASEAAKKIMKSEKQSKNSIQSAAPRGNVQNGTAEFTQGKPETNPKAFQAKKNWKQNKTSKASREISSGILPIETTSGLVSKAPNPDVVLLETISNQESATPTSGDVTLALNEKPVKHLSILNLVQTVSNAQFGPANLDTAPVELSWPTIPEFESSFFNEPRAGAMNPRSKNCWVSTILIEDPSFVEDIPGTVIASDIVCVFDCGHKLRINIDPSVEIPDALGVHCPAPCRRALLRCGHPCTKLCYEDCSCSLTSWRKYHCGHEALVKCSVFMSPSDVCEYPVEVPSPCGHTVWILCSSVDEMRPLDLAKLCTAPCDPALLEDGEGCGHPCPGNCSQCQQGRFHVRCKEPCGRTLICQHVCTTPCKKACGPCRAACELKCEHGQCQEECGVQCSRCTEPCTWEFPHQKCTRNCGEVCDREPCDEPCPKKLPCGHPCVSFCGEPCPSLCGICDQDKLVPGLIYSKDYVEPTDRFVLLQDCGHAIERTMLDQWMNVRNEEIHHKTCPLCAQIIYRCRRYVGILYTTQRWVAIVKERINGTWSAFMDAQKKLHALLCFPPSSEFNRFADMKDYVGDALPYDGVLKENETYSSYTARELESLVELAKIWLDAEEKVAGLEGHVPDDSIKLLEWYYACLFGDIMDRDFPLRPLEFRDLHRQLDRFHDMAQLFERQSTRRNHATQALLQLPDSKLALDTALKILQDCKPYDAVQRDEFKFALWNLDDKLHCQLGITDEERAEILQAINLPSGRWFKCPNGHIYLITECGGAMEISLCSECGVQIGGQNHKVVPGNMLATEMDGALKPAYPGSVVV